MESDLEMACFETSLGVRATPPSVTHGASPGCFHIANMTNDDYHSLPDSVSCSGLKHLLRSPAHFQTYLDQTHDDKPNLGSALHCLVLEGDVFNDTYIYFTGDRRGKVYNEFVAANPGKIILTEKEWITVHRMFKAVVTFADYPLWAALQSSKREMSVFWTDEETGVQCRVRFDALCAPYANFDLKSTTDARPEYFIKQAVRLDYDLQAAMYTEAARRFTGEILPFYFVAIEDAEPNGVFLLEAGQSMIDNGWRKFRKALNLYKQCTSTKTWPGYANPFSTLELPRYALLEE